MDKKEPGQHLKESGHPHITVVGIYHYGWHLAKIALTPAGHEKSFRDTLKPSLKLC